MERPSQFVVQEDQDRVLLQVRAVRDPIAGSIATRWLGPFAVAGLLAGLLGLLAWGAGVWVVIPILLFGGWGLRRVIPVPRACRLLGSALHEARALRTAREGGTVPDALVRVVSRADTNARQPD